MPKTFTDDVAPALPSSIDGPFQVVDPADQGSWIKIDPAGAGIPVAGSARPARTITRHQSRLYSVTYSTLIGSSMLGRRLLYNMTGGIYFGGLAIPSDMDVSEPSKVTIVALPYADATTNGQAVHFRQTSTHFKAGEAPTNTTIDCDWNVPDDWTTNDPRQIVIDNGNGVTFDASHFEHGDQVEFVIIRMGTDVGDTFDKDLIMAEYVVFEYTAKQY